MQMMGMYMFVIILQLSESFFQNNCIRRYDTCKTALQIKIVFICPFTNEILK